jgi:hypothetical protein
MNKCKGLDRYGDQCKKNKLENIDYCKFHEYLLNYNSEELEILSLCKGCLKWKYLENNNKTCNDCKNRGEQNNIKHKNNKILCKKEGCKYEKLDENSYCGKHQIYYFKEMTESLGKKVCYNYIRGCREQLNSTYSFSKCQECLQKERTKDKERRNKFIELKTDNKNDIKNNESIEIKKEINYNANIDNIKNNELIKIKKEINNNVNTDINDLINELELEINNNDNNTIIENIKLNTKNNNTNIDINKIFEEIYVNIDKTKYKLDKIIRHNNCFKDSDNNFIKIDFDTNLIKCSNDRCELIYPEKYFKSDTSGLITKQCQFCRDKGKEKDNKESRILWKQEWKEENHDKLSKYWMDYRGRKIEENVDAYLENNAKTMKNWRDNNPDKVKEINQKKKENINESFNIYKRDAILKNREFKLFFDDFAELIKKTCFYCEEIQDKGFNGIDRKDCTKGYIKENVVSCCKICNFIKGSLSDKIFIKRVEHILTYQNYIKGNLYPELFADHINLNYNSYKKRANIKEIHFELNEEIFYNIIENDCYICGKSISDNHVNGIDRIDNTKGYLLNNIESCCGECNYMKSNLNLGDFFEKLRKIRKNKLSNYEIINSTFRYFNKLKQRNFINNKINKSSIEVIREYERIKKQKQRNKVNIQEKNEIINNTLLKGHLNKKTEEEKREEAKLRKQKSRELLRCKYGNEEYKKKRALELSEYRKKIKN